MVKRSAATGGPIIDIGTTSLKLYDGPRVAELALERGARGEITAGCAARLREQLRGFFGADRKLGSTWCALPARGVSLRVLNLPPAPAEELSRLVRLQIERELPLPLEQLAWGFATAARNGAPPKAPSRITVAALRREVLAEYQQLFTEWPGEVTYCVGSVAITALVDELYGHQCILDVGGGASELLCLEDGAGRELRSLPWGGARVTRLIAERTGLSLEAAESLKRDYSDDRDTPLLREHRERVVATVTEELDRFAQQIAQAGVLPAVATAQNGSAASSALYIAGGGARIRGFAEALGRALNGVQIVRLTETGGNAGASAVAAGLRARPSRPAAPCIRFDSSESAEARSKTPTYRRRQWWWGGAAAMLAIVAIGVDRYCEPLMSSTRTAELVQVAETTLSGLPRYEQELAFRSELAGADLRALDVLAEVARLAPEGLVLKEFQINQRGAVQIVGQLASAELVNQLGRRLEESAWLSAVRVEATPAQGGNGASFRILAQRTRDNCPQRGPAIAPPAGSAAPTRVPAAAAGGTPKAADVRVHAETSSHSASKNGAPKIAPKKPGDPKGRDAAQPTMESAGDADESVIEVFDSGSIRFEGLGIPGDMQRAIDEAMRKRGGGE